MKVLTVGDLKTHFSEALKAVQNGEEIAITYGKKKEIVAYLVQKQPRKTKKRELGRWADKGSVTFNDDFKISDEELLGL